ncbi:MAG TPA: aldehyde dehydrogenase family protein [Micromonosporaceae bacterium]|nr:aldehyde dehydrogenase family protein [Micromonosporaceae bacterium]
MPDPTRPEATRRSDPTPRLAVRKTYKLFIGGSFPRSESSRSYPVTGAKGRFLANAALASRKDVRDAVLAARKAFPGWSGRTPYNRGQILYRIAEMLEGRRAQFIAEIGAAEGLSARRVEPYVDAAIDRWVWYAGWADKIAQVYGNANPVAGPYFNLSAPEPTGVVGVVAPQSGPDEPSGSAPRQPTGASFLGLVSVLAPAIVTGNTAVVLASERHPLPAITLAEVLATSDLPGGVVNLLTGRVRETAPWLASHMDVNAVDLTGIEDLEFATGLEQAAAENLKRVVRPGSRTSSAPGTGAEGAGPTDWLSDPGTTRLTAFLEIKTVWHPKGA